MEDVVEDVTDDDKDEAQEAAAPVTPARSPSSALKAPKSKRLAQAASSPIITLGKMPSATGNQTGRGNVVPSEQVKKMAMSSP